MNIPDFQKMKKTNKKISMITCYDYWSAKIVAQSDIDCILVGDSLAMIMHGHDTTIPATIELMALHVRAVAKGIKNKLIIGDMPFLSYRKGLVESMKAIEQLMQAGAHAIKLEGAAGNLELIQHAVESGIPVIGHLGLTPQAVHQLGGMHVQGREEKAAQTIQNQALQLQDAGCFAVVLECVPTNVAKQITENLVIPTIGIGAGPFTDGQVLVLQDMLGMDPTFKPKFLKTYFDGHTIIKAALDQFNHDVKEIHFPCKEHCY